ncbi:FimV family protein [Halomonas citrativorans]|uniref:LysM domain-containing protein n=1 Tax=Halomonas citrativorans TaxID=2742612 RepID=A0ABR9FF88_9GAMM|nr:FimV/HubP family polar landmark protein [Halomonas citrativorans]MBE0405162.1 hypothetical protein [Halomonas citrativorans]
MAKKYSNYRVFLKTITLLSIAGVPSFVQAIEAGPAEVESWLEAPLNASLPLLDSNAYALDELSVQVADEPAFVASGLEWMPLARQVHAEIQEQAGSRRIILRSPQSVTTPWLDLLLVIHSPEGQKKHAVTLLFDPVDYANYPLNQAEADGVAPSSGSEMTEPLPRAEVRVQEGDTLWRIASRSKPERASVQQMMLALVAVNPEFFPEGNINSLRTGQALRLPAAGQVQLRSADEAAHAVQVMVAGEQRANTTVPQSIPVDVEVETPPAPELATAQIEAELTRAMAGFAEQLEQSQASLLTANEEREQLRLELSELRHNLSQFIENSVSVEASPPVPLMAEANAAAQPIADVHGAPSSGVLSSIERYRWPFIALGLVLLLTGLMWRRKRREAEEPVAQAHLTGASLAEPQVFKPSPPISNDLQTSTLNIPLSSGARTSSAASDHFSSSASGTVIPERGDAFGANYAKSQAAGLAGHGSRRYPQEDALLLKGMDFKRVEAPELTPSETLKKVSTARSIGAEWEIEEVAFKPQGRDNG